VIEEGEQRPSAWILCPKVRQDVWKFVPSVQILLFKLGAEQEGQPIQGCSSLQEESFKVEAWLVSANDEGWTRFVSDFRPAIGRDLGPCIGCRDNQGIVVAAHSRHLK